MDAQLPTSVAKMIVQLAEHGTGTSYPLLEDLENTMLHPVMLELQNHNKQWDHLQEDLGEAFRAAPANLRAAYRALEDFEMQRRAVTETACFIAGMLAANPAAVLFGLSGAMVKSLGTPASGKDGA